jgi:glycosyltransferase involved in cell wall biosynthesis
MVPSELQKAHKDRGKMAALQVSSARPRIGLDMHVADGIFQGSRTHCLELFSRVIAATPECDFFIFASDNGTLLEFSSDFSRPHVRICIMPEMPAAIRILYQLPKLAAQHRLSLLHTQYIVPPFMLSCRKAVTVHDILFEPHPEFFGRAFVLRSRALVRHSVRSSQAVFTVSDYSHREICNTYRIPNDRVHTIPNGVDCKRFRPGNDGDELVRELGLTSGNYFLTVGRLEPRKNHTQLLRAWAMLPVPRTKLVIVGQRHFGYQEATELIRTLNLESDVVFFEQISDAQLPLIYRHARGFVYASLAEGFGMPLLEAMASGVPVITSSNTALAEVSADAALSIDPANPSQIADAVLRLDWDETLRTKLIDRGHVRTRDFSWERSAERVRQVYLRQLGVSNG